MTIKEIAELTQLSRGTVDRVIHNRPMVSEQARKKVQQVIEKYGFEPNKAGCALATLRKAPKIAVVFYSPQQDHFYENIFGGIKKSFEKYKDYGLSIVYKTYSEDTPESARKALLEVAETEGVTAIINEPFHSSIISETYNDLMKRGIQMITVSSDIEKENRLFFVGHDNYRSGRTASQMLRMIISKPKRILLLAGHMDYVSHQNRMSGIKEYFLECAPEIEIDSIIHENNDENYFYEAVCEYLSNGNQPDGMLIISRGLEGVIRALEEHSLAGKVKIGAFDIYNTTKKLLENEKISFIIDQDPVAEGELVMDYLYEFLATGAMPKNNSTYTVSRLIIKENIIDNDDINPVK